MKYLWSFILGLFIGAAVLSAWRTPTKVAEVAAIYARQLDGSLVLERSATSPNKKPEHTIPKGGKAERNIRVDVQPDRSDCQICTVDLTLVRMPDDSRRVVASSPTGTVMGGLDVPVLPIEITKKSQWAAGISRGIGAESWGGWLDRDFGPMRIGGEANKTGDNQYEARLKIGIRF